MDWNKIVEVILDIVERFKVDHPQINSIFRDDIFSVLEKICVVVYYPLKNEKNMGFHTKRYVKDKERDFVYINTAKQLTDQVFTAAHELGHVIGVLDIVKEKLNISKELSNKEEEDIIDRFAAELLMPKELFINSFEQHIKEQNLDKTRISLVDFVRVIVLQMDDYMVPYEAVRRRLVETGLVSEIVGEDLKNREKSVKKLVSEISKDINTVLDNETMKKTIPGLRSLLEKVEQEGLLDEYTICKIKQDFVIDNSQDIDAIILDIGDKVDGKK